MQLTRRCRDRIERARALGMADRDAHSRPLGGEAPHKPPAKKPCAAEHADRSHREYSCWMTPIVPRQRDLRAELHNAP